MNVMITSNLKSWVVVLAGLLSIITAAAQDKTLTGKVTVFDSIPLAGVKITVKSTQQVVLTDTAGLFQVMCRPEDKIVAEAEGFFPRRVKIDKDIRLVFINLELKKGDKNRQMAGRYVDWGYGHENADRFLSAVSSLNSHETDFSRYSSMFELIQGQFPGVSVEGNNIIVRGPKTFYGAEGNAALIVIDGAVVTSQDLANLSPLDVASIDILKDGSSSVYGSRGANGVVIIETKKGR